MSHDGFASRLRRILVVADDAARGRRLAGLLESEGLEPVMAGPEGATGSAGSDGGFAAVVVDERCLESAASEVVKALRKRDPLLAREAMQDHFRRLLESMIDITEARAVEELRKSATESRQRYLASERQRRHA